MKNKMLFKVFAGILATSLFYSCNTPANSGNDDKGGSGDKNSTQTSNLIKFNFDKASVLATTGLSNKARSARAADSEQYDSLVAITEDDEVVNVIEVSKELESWCVPKPVVEVYTCPYTSVEAECKGIYTVFEGPIQPGVWKHTDGSDAPGVSQLMYTKPDGTVVDVLNIDGNVNHYIQTYVKANDGNDYIKFDNKGNAFILANDGYNSVVYRYNPLNDSVTKYDTGLKSDKSSVWIGNFEITRDGSWIFLRVQRNEGENSAYTGVYAMEINSSKVIKVFENELNTDFDTNPSGGWVRTLTYNSTNNTLYFYNFTSKRYDKAGLYVLEAHSDGSFNPDDLKLYYKMDPWDFWNLARDKIMEEKVVGKNENGEDEMSWVAKEGVTDDDYKDFIAFLKTKTDYKGNPDDIVFDLSFFDSDIFKNAKLINAETGAEETYLHPATRRALAAKDGDGNYLKEVDALKYLLETPIYWNWNEENPSEYVEDDHGQSLMTVLNWISWGWEENVRDKNSDRYGYFLEAFLHHKDGKTDIFNYSSKHSDFTTIDDALALCNDDGTWVFTNVYESEDDINWYRKRSNLFQLTDRRGNFMVSQPDGIKDKKFYYFGSDTKRKDTDPWYKMPFEITSTGLAAISEDGKTIYYYSKGTVKDLLESDPNKSSILSIYSFTLSETKLIYNAVNTRHGYMMVSIDLQTGKATDLPLAIAVENMLSIK